MCWPGLLFSATNIVTPRIPVISNVDAEPHADPDTIKDILARQVRAIKYYLQGVHSPLVQLLT